MAVDKQRVRADEILYALEMKHRRNNDYFITQVKNGATHSAKRGELLIMDGLAIRKSWAKPCITAYEVKVSRSDFLGDAKWNLYAQYCHELYMVCPKGMIEKNEVYDYAGLIWYNPETKALSYRKRAEHRKIDISADMLMYIIMSKLEVDRHPFFSHKRERFEAYVADKIERRQLGYSVGKKWQDLHIRVDKAERKAKEFENVKNQLDAVVKVMRKYGVTNYWYDDIAEELDALLAKGGGIAKAEQLKDAINYIELYIKKANVLLGE